MKIKKTEIDGVYEIDNQIFNDQRGSFVKTFNWQIFRKEGLETDYRESFYSISKKNVLRGMHFQKAPHDHAKLVYVVTGEIMDVAVDIRKDSATFGRCHSAVLSGKNGKSLYMDKGFAHGFLTLSDSAVVVYLTTTVYSPSHDTGIRWDSFGFDWRIPKEEIILSDRDLCHVELSELNVQHKI